MNLEILYCLDDLVDMVSIAHENAKFRSDLRYLQVGIATSVKIPLVLMFDGHKYVGIVLFIRRKTADFGKPEEVDLKPFSRRSPRIFRIILTLAPNIEYLLRTME
jgi:hypothetical protein